MSVTCASGCLGSKLMTTNFNCAGTLPTSFTGSLIGTGVVGYTPSFRTISASGNVLGVVSYSCSPGLPAHFYNSWNAQLSCTLSY